MTTQIPTHKPVRKAVIPAAGFGTRFLPATKSIPKEMLPIVDKPVIQFVIEEAIASGIDDILIITSRSKATIETHFDHHPDLETFLASKGKTDLIDQVRSIGQGARIHYIRQKEPRGLGDAIRLARDHCGDQPFAVLLGDTIIKPHENQPAGLRQLLDIFDLRQASVVSVQHVPPAWIPRYGIVDGPADPATPDLWCLNQLIEKPSIEKAPTDLAIAGRYVFTPQIFDCIDQTSTGVGGEIQLTDAMNLLARNEPMFALAWKAQRYDIGNRAEYAKCFLDYALARPDTGEPLLQHLRQALGLP